MTFKDKSIQFQILDLTLIEPDPAHPRQHFDDASLKGLDNAIQKRTDPPANRSVSQCCRALSLDCRRAALAGGDYCRRKILPVLIHACTQSEPPGCADFENLCLGVRAELEQREMANAIQYISEHF